MDRISGTTTFVQTSRRTKWYAYDGPSTGRVWDEDTATNIRLQITVREIRPAPKRCECPNGEENCVCPVPEILTPVKVPRNSRSTPRSERSSFVSPVLTVQPSSMPQNQRQLSVQFSSQRSQRQQAYPQPQQIPSCPCPPAQTNCVCMNVRVHPFLSTEPRCLVENAAATGLQGHLLQY